MQGHVIEDGKEISSSYYRMYDSPDPTSPKVQDCIYMYDQNSTTAGRRPEWIQQPFGPLIFSFPAFFYVYF
jgi:hypothetical protein